MGDGGGIEDDDLGVKEVDMLCGLRRRVGFEGSVTVLFACSTWDEHCGHREEYFHCGVKHEKAFTSEHKDAVPVHIYLHIYQKNFYYALHWQN